MSYDVSLYMDTGAGNSAECGWWNMTSNVAPMWRRAGADLSEFDGKNAFACVGTLNQAIQTMATRPTEYEALNPENGWGDYEGCLKFLQAVRDACERHPLATVRVSR